MNQDELATPLTERDWQLLLTGAKELVLTPGQKLLEQGHPNAYLYRLRRGILRVEKASASDKTP